MSGISSLSGSARRTDASRRGSDLLRIPGAGRGRPTAWAPIVLALVTVGLQLVYPVAEGDRLRLVTAAAVLSFAAAVVSHAWLVRGRRQAARLVVVAGGGGLLAEVVGVATGVPFGEYSYSGTLGPELLGVPVLIPLAWIMMAYPAAVVGRRIASSTVGAVAVAALALAAWDLFLDPQMVAAGHWSWSQPGPSLAGIPLVNHLGWVLVALLISALLVPGLGSARDDRVPVGLYLWTWLGSIVAHAVVLDLPTSAVSGGVAMGAVVVALVWSSTTPSGRSRRRG